MDYRIAVGDHWYGIIKIPISCYMKPKNEYGNINVLVLGLGISGRSAAKFLLERGAKVAGADKNLEKLEENAEVSALKALGLQIFRDSDPILIDSFSLVVASPGVSPKHPLYATACEKGIEVIGEIELACRHISQPLIGITGTNGKTTVSLLVGHIFNSLGRKAQVLGNAGVPLTSQISGDLDEIIVCELSSYQLETLQVKIIDCGVILNITPDHLDRYQAMTEYAKAKVWMEQCIRKPNKLYVGESVKKEYYGLFKRIPKTFGFNAACDVYCDTKAIFIKENIEMILPGDYRGKSNHDVENLMAAYAMCHEMGVAPKDFLNAFSSFKKPPHRIEYVKTINGINFFNDSKGTNLDAVIRAVDSMEGNVVLIAGGLAKGAEFTSWISAFGNKVKGICAIGEAKNKLVEDLSKRYSVTTCDSLESAVKQAFTIAQEGENVLLSPGCASLDMFKNFEHRGDCFKEIVLALEEREAKKP